MKLSGFGNRTPLSLLHLEPAGARTMNVFDFIEVAADFIEENYRGLVRISYDVESYERVTVSEYHLARLFKKLVSISGFNKLVNVKFTCNYMNFSIEMSYDGGERFDRSSEREIIKLARDAGFEARRSGAGLVIYKEVFKSAVISVFTRPSVPSDLRKIFHEVFFEEK